MGGAWVRATLFPLLVLIPLLRPSWGVCLMFLALPFFGNRPGGRYMEVINIPLGASLVGLALRALRRQLPPPGGAIWALAWACVLTAWVAVVPAMPGLVRRLSRLHGLSAALIHTFTSRETDPLYTINSACLLTLAVGWATALAWARTDRLAVTAGRATIAALLFTTLLGILDFHGVIDLDSRYLLYLDPLSLDDAAFKSIFWNPGWFAWYFSIAFGVSLGFWAIEPRRRRVVLLGALAVCYAYFLTNRQRGGFLAVHAALALVVIHGIAHSRHRRLALFRGAVAALAVTALTTLLLVQVPRASVWLLGLRRLVTSPGDDARSKLAVTALRMWQDAPLFGIGEGAFAWRYREFVPRHSPLEVVTYGDAHDTWLQILATRGIVGLVIYAWLWLGIAMTSVRALRITRRSLALPFSAGLSAFFVYSFVQGMFYLQAIQVFFWGLFALLVSRGAARNLPSTREGVATSSGASAAGADAAS